MKSAQLINVLMRVRILRNKFTDIYMYVNKIDQIIKAVYDTCDDRVRIIRSIVTLHVLLYKLVKSLWGGVSNTKYLYN